MFEGDPKAPQHRRVGEAPTPFPRLLYFALDPYFLMLRVRQGSIK